MPPAPLGASIPPRGSKPDLGLSAGAAGRFDYRGDIPVDLDRVPVSVNGRRPMSVKQSQYGTGLDKTPAN